MAFLDLDIGQPEHAPPGAISLSLVRAPILSPPYSRMPASARTLEATTHEPRAAAGGAPPLPALPLFVPAASEVLALRFLGASSVKEDPQLAADACADLVALYRATLAPVGIPLVVNTHGWVRGVGFLTTQAALDSLAPSHLVSLVADTGALQRQASPTHGGPGAPEWDAAADPGGAEEEAPRGGDWDLRAPSRLGADPARARAREVLTAPEVCLPATGGASAAPTRSVTYTLPPWHVLSPPVAASAPAAQYGGLGSGSATGAEFGDAPSQPAMEDADELASPAAALSAPATAAGARSPSIPPRAVRSPAEQRAMRVMHYLLCGLRPAVEAAVIEGDGESGESESSSEEEDGDSAEGEALSADEARDDGGAPAAPLSPFEAHLRAVGALVSSAYARVASERAEARNPTAGARSPAFAVQAAAAVVVPLMQPQRSRGGGVRLCYSASMLVPVPGGAADPSPPSSIAIDARALDGTLVGLCSARLAAALAASRGQAPPAALAAGRLPCIGLALVRRVLGGGAALELLTPVPRATLAALLDTVVAWGEGGPPDVPAQLLFRDSAAGDAWAAPARTVAPTSAATARSDAPNRRFLKRKRG